MRKKNENTSIHLGKERKGVTKTQQWKLKGPTKRRNSKNIIM